MWNGPVLRRDADITPSVLGLHAKADPEACAHGLPDEDIVRSALGVSQLQEKQQMDQACNPPLVHSACRDPLCVALHYCWPLALVCCLPPL